MSDPKSTPPNEASNASNASLEGFVAKLTAMRGPGETLEIYDDWAETYEEDLIENYGYTAPQIAVEAFRAAGPGPGPIIDFGCGTGLVGVELSEQGFSQIDGVDISPKMLAQAGEKGVYRDLIEGDLTRRTTIADASYANALAVGCFGSGHLGPEHLGELVRTVREGGLIVLYTNGIPFVEDDYPSYLEALAAKNWWQLLTVAESNYMQGRDRPGWVIVARRGTGVIST